MNYVDNGFFVLATNKTLQVTFWTRLRDLIKGVLLYGSINWRRASDGLNPPRLSPLDRKIAMPAKNLDVIRPRENPQAALYKAQPKKVSPEKSWDITAGAIVSDPLLIEEAPPTVAKQMPTAAIVREDLARPVDQVASLEAEQIVVHRRRRRHRHGTHARTAPRSLFRYADETKPGLLARWFGSK